MLVLNVLPVLAGNSKGELSSVSTVEVGKDTVPFRISPDFLKNNDIESFDDIDNSDNDFVDESAAYDPNFDYYGIWDTISVNPYKMDLTQKPDTTLIILQDRYQCDYNHPYCGNITSDFGPKPGTLSLWSRY